MFGTIKRIVRDKGFGFIVRMTQRRSVLPSHENGPKVYFEDLREGEEVEFQVRKGDKGPQAFNLSRGDRGHEQQPWSAGRWPADGAGLGPASAGEPPRFQKAPGRGGARPVPTARRTPRRSLASRRDPLPPTGCAGAC